VSKPATQSGFVKLPTILTQLVVDVGAALAVLIATATPSVFKPAGDPSRLGDDPFGNASGIAVEVSDRKVRLDQCDAQAHARFRSLHRAAGRFTLAVSVATLIGFIALAGVAAEFGIIMLLYLRHAWERQLAANPSAGEAELDAAIREGAVQRVRPKAMTVAVILAGLFPILIGSGAGSEVMQRIAAPMVGGMLSAPLLSMLVIPAAYRLLQRRRLRRSRQSRPSSLSSSALPT